MKCPFCDGELKDASCIEVRDYEMYECSDDPFHRFWSSRGSDLHFDPECSTFKSDSFMVLKYVNGRYEPRINSKDLIAGLSKIYKERDELLKHGREIRDKLRRCVSIHT